MRILSFLGLGAVAVAVVLLFSQEKAEALMAYVEDDPAMVTAATAIFAGGCFWCMEKPFDHTNGVTATFSGYTGGHQLDPTYAQVSAGGTGHYEALRVEYNPQIVSFSELLEIFWRNIDPFDARGQFCDKGDQYRAAIFVHNESERAEAEASLAAMEARFDRNIVTEILPAARFYDAEANHQNYYSRNPIRYNFYRGRCGRDDRLEEVWGDESGGID